MKNIWNLKKYFPLLFLGSILLTGCGQAHYLVFDPVGPVGKVEKDLINLTILLCTVVVVPVILILGYIVYRYRDTPGNRAKYRPEWSESGILEVIWWGIPIVIIGILGIVTVKQTFLLSRKPVKPQPPLTIQVMSLDWKWLFLYPDQNIATVNYCQIPTNRTVEFVLTSNAPMNSFWVPQLGGQEYTMSGMAMRLWLEADKSGDYFGTGANFSGKGFAHMKFHVYAKPAAEFTKWVDQAKHASTPLTLTGYQNLVAQGISQEATFSSFPKGIFDDVVMQEGGMYNRKHHMSDSSSNTSA